MSKITITKYADLSPAQQAEIKLFVLNNAAACLTSTELAKQLIGQGCYWTPKAISGFLVSHDIQMSWAGETEFKKWLAENCTITKTEKDGINPYKFAKTQCARYGCDQLFVPKHVNHKFCNPLCAERADTEKKLLEKITEEPDPAIVKAAENELVKELERQNGVLQRSLLKEQTKTSVLLMRIDEHLESMPEPRFSVYPARPLVKSGGGSETEAHFCLGDTQAGKLESGNGLETLLNDYLPKLAEKVMRCVDVQRSEGPVDTFYLHLLGDIVEGCQIYAGSRNFLDSHLNGQSSVDQVLLIADAISDIIIARLRPNFKRFVVCNAWGNHGRTGTKQDPSLPKDNLDRLVAEIIKRMCSHMNIEWNIPEEDRYVVESKGFNIGAIHGHQLGNKSSLNSMELPILRWDAIQRFGKPLDILLLGHRHHSASLEIQGIEVIQNAAIDGGSSWFTDTNGSWSLPSQELFFVSEEYGISTRKRLYVTQRIPRERR